MDHYEEAKKLYIEGKSLRTIEEMIGFPRKKLSRLLKNDNLLRVFHNGTSLETKCDYEQLVHYGIVQEYLAGKSILELSMEFDFSASKINRILEYHKTDRSRSYRSYTLKEDVFEKVDDEDSAYWLGFLYADGYISNDGNTLEIGLSSKDRDHLEKFKLFIQTDSPIKDRDILLNGKLFPSSRVQICSRKLVSDLSVLGCMNKKSLILEFPTTEQVPEHLVQHFMRGYFDGDGCYHLSKTDKQRQFSIIGTESFVERYEEILFALGVNRTKISRCGQAYQSRHGGNNQVNKITSFLYDNASIYLERKYNSIFLPSPEETPVMMSAELSGEVLPENTGQPEPKALSNPTNKLW